MDLTDAAMLKFKVIAGLLLLAGLAVGVVWYGEWRADAEVAKVTSRYELAIGKQKLEAGRLLRDAGDNALRLERELNTAHARLEEMGNDRIQMASVYERRLAAAAAGGRLRDPNAARCGGGGGGPAAPGAAAAVAGEGDRSEAGGLLSKELTGLLQRLTREADTLNDAYAVCRQDSIDLRASLQLSPPQLVQGSQ